MQLAWSAVSLPQCPQIAAELLRRDSNHVALQQAFVPLLSLGTESFSAPALKGLPLFPVDISNNFLHEEGLLG